MSTASAMDPVEHRVLRFDKAHELPAAIFLSSFVFNTAASRAASVRAAVCALEGPRQTASREVAHIDDGEIGVDVGLRCGGQSVKLAHHGLFG